MHSYVNKQKILKLSCCLLNNGSLIQIVQKTFLPQMTTENVVFSIFVVLVSGHLCEGLVQLLSNGLELVLLSNQLVLQPVNLSQNLDKKIIFPTLPQHSHKSSPIFSRNNQVDLWLWAFPDNAWYMATDSARYVATDCPAQRYRSVATDSAIYVCGYGLHRTALDMWLRIVPYSAIDMWLRTAQDMWLRTAPDSARYVATECTGQC